MKKIILLVLWMASALVLGLGCMDDAFLSYHDRGGLPAVCELDPDSGACMWDAPACYLVVDCYGADATVQVYIPSDCCGLMDGDSG